MKLQMAPLLVLIIAATFISAAIASEQPATSSNLVVKDHDKNDKFQEDSCKLCNEPPTAYFSDNSLTRKFDGHVTFDEYIRYAMRSVKLIAGFDNDLHRYDNHWDLIYSFERNLTYNDDATLKMRARIDPSEMKLLDKESELTLIENERNQEICGRHLNYLIGETRKLMSTSNSYLTSKQLSLIDFIESFGSIPMPMLMMGNFISIGSQPQCVSSTHKIFTGGQQEEFKSRYCIANFRSPTWHLKPSDDPKRMGSESIKLGVCLPKSCNSISILRHSDKIEKLIKLARMNQVPYESFQLTNLFCLPDESSPLRQFCLSAKIFIATLSLWLSLVAYYSIKYEFMLLKVNVSSDDDKRLAYGSIMNSKMMKIFAFRLSYENLFDIKSSLPVDSIISRTAAKKNDTKLQTNVNHQLSGKYIQNLTTYVTGDTQLSHDSLDNINIPPILAAPGSKVNATNRKTPSVDLASIDGIKVISMIWLISAHTLLFFIRGISNGRDFWSILKDARFVTIMAGIFPVDSFFTITGILTAYLKFNKQDGMAMRKAKYWLEAFVHRYLRFMPMYLLVFWYTRDVSEYIGSGPLWDYSTADTSLRSVCKQESVLVPLLFQANFKPIDQHCVKPAWYLANDYQYLLMTPIFIALLMKSRLLGYLFIGISMAASLAGQFFTVLYSKEFTDFDALVNFKPMFATYVLKDLWRLYVLPYNRLPPYLIGLLAGHLMYMRNKKSSARVRRHKEKLEKYSFSESTSDTIIRQSKSEQSISSSASVSTIDSSSQDAEQHDASTANMLASNSRLCNHRTSTSGKISAASNNPQKCGTQSLIVLLRRFVCANVWSPLMALISIIYLPLITKVSVLPDGPLTMIGASGIIALMRFVWSVAIARLVYVCATRFMRKEPDHQQQVDKVDNNNVISNNRLFENIEQQQHSAPQCKLKGHTNIYAADDDSFVVKFLSSPKWKPWSKIGLPVLLIQWEVISYLAQTQTSLPTMTITILMAFILLCIVATYSLAILIYLTIEYPLTQIEQLYIQPLLFNKL